MKIRRWASLAATGAGAVYASRKLRQRKEMNFMGRSVLITGARGLGLVLARKFAEERAHLTLLARDEDELREAEQDLTGRGAQVMTLVCDVRERAQAEGAIERAVQEYGRIDVLINNAGVISVGPLEHMEIEDFDDSIATHFYGPLYLIRAATPHMVQQGGGRIVNIASIGGKIAVPHLAPYSAGKFALIGLSDGVRAELGKYGIYVTTVVPGLMRTGSPPNAFFKGQHHDEYTWFAISDSLPGISIDADHAAVQIVDAARYGDPALTITLPARLAAIMNNLTPSLIANIMSIVARTLPAPAGREGDLLKTGWESQSSLAPSALTTLSDQATVENNELRGHAPDEIEEQRERSAS